MIKDVLKKLRGTKRQDDVANDLGITQSAYSNYEAGRRSPDAEMIKRIALYYNVSTDYILGLSDNKSLNEDEALSIDSMHPKTLEIYSMLMELNDESKKIATEKIMELYDKLKKIEEYENKAKELKKDI